MNKSILLLQSKIGAWDELKSSYSIPLSLLQSVVLAHKQGYSIKLVDQRLDHNWKHSIETAISEGIYWAGTSAMCGPQILHSLDMLAHVKSIDSSIPTVIGGKHASLIPEIALKEPSIDIVMKGDAELSALALTESVSINRSLYSNPTVRTMDVPIGSKLKKVITQTHLTDLNSLPFPPYELVDVNRYQPKWKGHRILDVFTSQGCPNACNFCYNPVVYGRQVWRSFSSDFVKSLLTHLKDTYNIEGVWFVDDEFFGDLSRAKLIIEHIKKLDLVFQVQGTAINTVSGMSNDYLALLDSAGLTQMNMGVESASLSILKMVCKRSDPNLVKEVNRKLKPFSIVPWYYFMTGFPEETKADIEQTVNLAMTLLNENPNARISPFACFSPYPNTPMYRLALRYGFKPPETFSAWAKFATDNINNPWITKERFNLINTLQFTSLFVDGKPEDRLGSFMMQLLAKLYRPIARYRFRNLSVFGSSLERRLGFFIRDRTMKPDNDR